MPLIEYLDKKWLPSLELDPSTMYEYKRGVEYIRPHIGNTALGEVTPFHIENVISKLPEGSRRRRARKILSVSLNAAVRWKLLAANPVSQAAAKIGEGEKREYALYSPHELYEVLEAFQGHVAEATILVIAFCGLRKEEALALDWDDIDTENGIVHIRDAWAMAAGRPKDKKLKTEQSYRDTYISGYGLERLRAIRSDGPIWKGKKYSRVRPDAATRTYRRHIEKCGLRYVPPFALRHTNATILLASGVDVAVVSHGLGHSRVSTTVDRYVKPLKQQREAAAGTFAEVIGKQIDLKDEEEASKAPLLNSQETPKNYGKKR
jgi:integrase